MPKAKIEPAQYSMRPMNGSVSIVRPLSFICSTFLSRVHSKYLSPGVSLIVYTEAADAALARVTHHGSWSLTGPPHDGQDIGPPRDRDRSASAAMISATMQNVLSNMFIYHSTSLTVFRPLYR
jgi:hypothetical protein